MTDNSVRFEPRFNFYRCDKCAGYLVTVDVNAGLTPEKLACRAKSSCGGTMHSGGYADPTKWPAIVPWGVQAVWYRPSAYERQQFMKAFPSIYNFVNQGGLVIRGLKRGEQFTLPPRTGYGT